MRPPSIAWAEQALRQLDAVGVRHVELAWRSDHPQWVEEARHLRQLFPALAFGAASISSVEGLAAAAAAGFGYAVSPVLDRALLAEAAVFGVHLVPGVMTPSEVHHARALGCSLVKLFPAVVLGPGYWGQLRQPLGEPLPRVLAAGGLQVREALAWLAAGVDAVALGGSLFRPQSDGPVLDGNLAMVMAALARRSGGDGCG